MSKIEKLESLVQKTALFDFPHHSRVHPLVSCDRAGIHAFVKREDEIGGLGGGAKVRKYLSLLPHLLNQNYEEAILIGSPFSNHILCFSGLLIQNKIKPVLFLYKTHTKKTGNYLWTSLLVPEENIHWIDKDNIDGSVQAYIKNHDKKIAVIPEGASMIESLTGALTLSFDILRNEKESGLEFDHIIIDSGTGMMASALILAFSYIEKKSTVHVVQMGGNKEEFLSRLNKYKQDFEGLLKISSMQALSYKLYFSETNRSFGSHSKELFANIIKLSRKEGFLTDPVFSGKLFMTGNEIVEKENLKGNVLYIHSGGYSALTGYQDILEKLV